MFALNLNSYAYIAPSSISTKSISACACVRIFYAYTRKIHPNRQIYTKNVDYNLQIAKTQSYLPPPLEGGREGLISYGRVLQYKETAIVDTQGDVRLVVVVGFRMGVLVQDTVAELAFHHYLRDREIVETA